MLAFMAMLGGGVAEMGMYLMSRGFPGDSGVVRSFLVVSGGAALLLVRFLHGSWRLGPARKLRTA